MLSKLKVQNCISKKYGLYSYECKDSRCNLCATYIEECSSFITSNGYNWKIRCHINCHSINVLYFLSRNSFSDNTNGNTIMVICYLPLVDKDLSDSLKTFFFCKETYLLSSLLSFVSLKTRVGLCNMSEWFYCISPFTTILSQRS